MKSRIYVVVFFLLITSLLIAQTPAQTIPDFSFSKFDKTSFTNKNLATGKSLFFFFFDCDCDHCQHAMANLNEHYKDYKKAAVYLISLDNQEMMKAFMYRYAPNVISQKNVTMLQDTKNQFIIRFKPRKYPSLFLYDANKKLLDYEDNPENMFRFSKLLNTASK